MPDSYVDFFTKDPAVVKCIEELEAVHGKNGRNLVVSDVLDDQNHQYVHLVQKGGGVLGVALVGYTYVLEQMNIRFIRLAGTSAGAINTALMTMIGGSAAEIRDDSGRMIRKVHGDKKMAKSEEILQSMGTLDFFGLVDGHPAARTLIKWFVGIDNFQKKCKRVALILSVVFGALIIFDLVAGVIRSDDALLITLSKISGALTTLFIVCLLAIIAYTIYLLHRLKTAGYGINPGKYFFNWVKEQMDKNGVQTVSDLISKASTPVDGLYLREENDAGVKGLEGDVTFITSELVTQNKIEFPGMSDLFSKEIDDLHPAAFVRASMSIPIFFESYFIENIPCADPEIVNAWKTRLGQDDPPTIARFVDGGILSNFPINLFYNPNVTIPRLPSFGIDLDDEIDPKTFFDPAVAPKDKLSDDKSKNPEKWTLLGYIGRLFNTVRFYYDKDFLIKNAFFKTGIGKIPLLGYGWLNFFMSNDKKKEMFILGARAAAKFLNEFNWEEYKDARVKMQASIDNT